MMSDWKDVVTYLAVNVDDHYDALKLRLRKLLGIRPVHILPYLGYGTHQTCICAGVL